MNYKKLPTIDYKKLESFRVRISQIPPFDVAFKEMALTDYEMLVATIYRLNELIEINQEFIDFNSEIWEWVTNDGVSLAVIDRLNEWLDDGTLETLINDTLFNMKLDKQEFITFKSTLQTQLIELENDLSEEIILVNDKIDGVINTSRETVNAKEFGVIGDGVTDDTIALQEAINHVIEYKKRLFIPKGRYLITDTLIVEFDTTIKNFDIVGDGEHNTILLGRMVDKFLFDIRTVNAGGHPRTVEIGYFSILPFSKAYRYEFSGLKLTNVVALDFKHIWTERLNHAVYLTMHSYTSEEDGFTGYTEQNLFEECDFNQSLNGITFNTGNRTDNPSFHGNMFKKVALTVNSDLANGREVTGLNMEGGTIYNCFFDIRMFVDGENANIMFIDAPAFENVGNITVECFSPVNIKTGNRENGRFIFNGELIIYPTQDFIMWDKYSPILNTQTENTQKIGFEKLRANNFTPPQNNLVNKLIGKNGGLLTLNTNIKDVFNGVNSHSLYRYANKSGELERGYLLTGRSAVPSDAKIITGVYPLDETSDISFRHGFNIHLDGSKIESVNKDNYLSFHENFIRNKKGVIHDVETNKTYVSNNMYIEEKIINNNLDKLIVFNGKTASVGGQGELVVNLPYALSEIKSIIPTPIISTPSDDKEIIYYIKTYNNNSFTIYYNSNYTFNFMYEVKGLKVNT